ncbi:SDR family NAD(P)-dependent oxidoreductase [Legionella maioricensis]|uniref:SDR family NAD(P)-dependent oxidoreductase n=1 Tax=Legionella maioricensis TaxID=2896528 RepID=A0A9X2IAX9_9GAMM|nr:SDR family NAD(P)-dependent oxidoreductase [Legionella maioricensis]MCL9684409.1 SDR family NAD(P)-dependent oxidoreductase [Legionella maioricensis]MCL9687590.1 SDR family NAD(P)-dependent oxidoreductase [Legionella maioricensis]
MIPRTWVILGATSIIAEKFAHCVAAEGHHLRLVGRDSEQLEIIAQDIRLRYEVPCDIVLMEMTEHADKLITILKPCVNELDLFIAHSDFTGNNELNPLSITKLIEVNVLATTLLTHAYLNLNQTQHYLFYLSSVAACRGRSKNSLYGGSKAVIEVYLEGLQQSASETKHITVVRLGFIDTKQTYGLPGIFHAADPQNCAKACWKAIKRKKRKFYYPAFWRAIMALITRLPFFIYKKMGAM